MPTRTINLKLQISPKTDEGRKIRSALWTTHSEINKAVAEIEKLLLLCRGEKYYTTNSKDEEVEVPEPQVKTDALEMARAVQAKNGKAGTGSDEEVLSALRMLYEATVPSSVLDDKGKPLSGDAQSIGGSYAGPICDPETCRIKDVDRLFESGPFAETASKKFTQLPAWFNEVTKKNFNKDEPEKFVKVGKDKDEKFYEIDLRQADAWYESPEVKDIVSKNKAFNKDKWWKNKRDGVDTWAAEFVKKQFDLRKDVRVSIREELWDRLGLLPLGSLYFKKPVGNKWNRMAFRLAIAHLLSWESWNHQTLAEYTKYTKYKDGLIELAGASRSLEVRFEPLRQYQKERHEELSRTSFVDDDRPFTIGARMIRAWGRVREAWRNKGDGIDERRQILADLQTELKGKFGDPHLFLWLAEAGRESLWRDEDVLTTFVEINIAQRDLERHRPYSLMTFADARLHPRWAMYEALGGTNLRNYELTPEGKVKIPLLICEKDKLSEKTFTIPLAPSGQLKSLEIKSLPKKKVKISYASAHQFYAGIPGGSEILFDRLFMENRASSALANGSCGPAWLKLTVDVESKAPPEWLDKKGRVQTPPTVHHFKTGLANKSKHTDKLEPSLRVLSVDLGLRTFASCSVFELVDEKPAKGLFFETDHPHLWAKHERSFKLTLPGEEAGDDPKVAQARREAMDEVYSLRRDMYRLKDILRLKIISAPNERREKLESKIAEMREKQDARAVVTSNFFERLSEKCDLNPPMWEHSCNEIHRDAEKAFSARIGEWRKRTRKRPGSWEEWRETRSYHGGKSYWMIEYLEAVRKLLIGWSTHGRDYGEINRQNKKRYGTVASKLLKHINKLKEDRTKAGTDLIIQAARGYIPLPGKGWMEKYRPCRVILFEDLARYRFKVDRPRRENSQLMKWGHREIINEATLQGEIYGMVVETAGAGFSSRFHAKTGAPGVRCRYLKEDDFENGAPKEFLVRQMKNLMKGDRLEPGLLVPWDGGELFATVDNGKPIVIHADINAAQNLQRRFWTRFADAYRVNAVEENDNWVVTDTGVRVLGALEMAVHGEADRKPRTGFTLHGTLQSGAELKAEGKKTDIKDVEEDKDDSISSEIIELQDEKERKGRETFFRDPSGGILDPGKWYGSKRFWGRAKGAVTEALLDNQGANNALEEKPGNDELPF